MIANLQNIRARAEGLAIRAEADDDAQLYDTTMDLMETIDELVTARAVLEEAESYRAFLPLTVVQLLDEYLDLQGLAEQADTSSTSPEAPAATPQQEA